MTVEQQGLLWGVGLLLPILGVSAWLLWKDMTYQRTWVLLPGTRFAYLPSQTNGTALAAASEMAIHAVLANTRFTDPVVRKCLDGWRISTRDTPKFWDALRRKVAGETYEWGVVEIGSDYAALAHEFCHVVSMKMLGETLADHEDPRVKARWEDLGFGATERAYVRELRGAA